MDNTKITKVIDNLGRILIPKDLRKQVNFEEYDELELFVENGCIVLQKKMKRCVVCTSETNLLDIGNNKYICRGCKSGISNIENM